MELVTKLCHCVMQMKVERRQDDDETSSQPSISRLLTAVENELQAGWEKGDPTERGLQVTLEDAELWRKFQHITNEMVVTKTGRRMFPVLKVNVSGLDPGSMYSFLLDFIPADSCRWKFVNGEWLTAGQAEGGGAARDHAGIYVHPDSPNFGAHWMKATVAFNKVKLTNKRNAGGQIMLNSLHKYEPHLHIVCVGSQNRLVSNVFFEETQFIAVTAYQNEELTALKIKHNPFAKAFLDTKDRNLGGRGLAEQMDGNVGIPPCWSLCSPGGGATFSYGGSLSLPSHHQHGYQHRGYAGRHSPYHYLPHCSHPSGVQVLSEGWSSTFSDPPTNNMPTTLASNSSSQYPCLWTTGCGEMSPSPLPCVILQGSMSNEYVMQSHSGNRAGGAWWASDPAQSL
ncbi:T-box transcription factor TBX19-like [Syngnathus acus]|uniref:T-box transcription factor TBX19-like n=1 Tax=Syngnathus acus TaxID=161584 RepID=UPI001885F3CE|nr:T-box transcription factor TBX19-like [Syngnathus acus]